MYILGLGAVQVLRNRFRGLGFQAKVLQLITIFKGGGSSQSITVLQFLRKGTEWRLFYLALQNPI